jgi:hypothetical protein
VTARKPTLNMPFIPIKDTEKQKDFDKRYATVKNEWPELIIAIEDLAQACREMTLEPLKPEYF